MGVVMERWCPTQQMLGVLLMKRVLLASVAALSVLSASAVSITSAFASWGDVWQCGKIKVTHEYSPSGSKVLEPRVTFDGPRLKHLRFKLLGHGRAKLNGKLCKALPDEGWI